MYKASGEVGCSASDADLKDLHSFPKKKEIFFFGLALMISLLASFSKEIGVTVFAVF